MNENNTETICEAIYTLLPEVQCLKDLFQSWTVLSFEDRLYLDKVVSNSYRPEYAELYVPLKEALVRWEHIQLTEGAPGCDPGLVSFSCQPQLESELLNVIYSVIEDIDKINVKKRVNTKPTSLKETPSLQHSGDRQVMNRNTPPSTDGDGN